MKFRLTILALALMPMLLAGGLAAQSVEPSVDSEQQALRDAKARATKAERRSEALRQEASNAEDAADKLVAQRAAMSAEIEAAEAQIAAANARLAIIATRQRAQRSKLGIQSEPMLRLNAALQAMTGRSASLMIAQPGDQTDYIHLRAVMATVQPEIARRTATLRQQIAAQNELRAQELLALKTLGDAKTQLADRRTALARLEGSARNRAGALSADAAAEFEQAIAQGERARDIVERIDTIRTGGENAAALAALDGPLLRSANSKGSAANNGAYIIPGKGSLIFGFNELTETGYRQRGITLAMDPEASVKAPASGKVTYAGRYRSFGNIIIIEHGGGWTSLVTNISNLSVAKGQRISQGQSLGNVGEENTEITLELRRHGRTMDIASLLL